MRAHETAPSEPGLPWSEPPLRSNSVAIASIKPKRCVVKSPIPYDYGRMISVGDDLKGRDFVRVADWAREELVACLDLADQLKEAHARREEHRLLPGRTLGMIFQKPSTRTRVSFEAGIAQLGGTGLYLSATDLHLGRGERIRDTALVLSRYLDA